MKIMIVEDEDNIREGLVSLLDWKKAGFDPPVLFGGGRSKRSNIWKRKKWMLF